MCVCDVCARGRMCVCERERNGRGRGVLSERRMCVVCVALRAS